MNRRCGSSKPAPTPLNGLAMKPGNHEESNRTKHRHYKKANHPSNLPRTASVAGGARRKRHDGKTNHRQNPPVYRPRGAGGRDEERRIEVEHRREDKRKRGQNPRAGYRSGGGGEDKRRTPTRNGKVAQPTVPRGGRSASPKTHSREKTK